MSPERVSVREEGESSTLFVFLNILLLFFYILNYYYYYYYFFFFGGGGRWRGGGAGGGVLPSKISSHTPSPEDVKIYFYFWRMDAVKQGGYHG